MGNTNKQTGFTIVELLIVIVVIAILAAITIVAYNGISNRAKESAVSSSLTSAAKKVANHYTSSGDTYPATLAELGVVDSGSTTFTYTPNNVASVKSYAITATNNDTTWHIAGTPSGIGKVVTGPFPGHPGTQAPLAGCAAGYISVPGNSLFGTQSFCVMKYEARNGGSSNAVSTASGTPWASISQNNAITTAAAACSGCHLVTDNEWLTIASNVFNVASNWSGGAVGNGSLYVGHADGTPAGAQASSTDDGDFYINTGAAAGTNRRILTLTNGEVIWDFTGNVREFTQSTVAGGQPGTSPSSAAWRQWTAIDVVGSNPSFIPNYSTPALNGMNTAQGIGQIFSDSTDTTLRAVSRGGGYADGIYSGIFSTVLNTTPTNPVATTGFRVAK